MNVVVSNFKLIRDIMNCGIYRGVGLLEHVMKIVEQVLVKIVMMNDMQFSFVLGRGTVDATLFLIVTRLMLS